ncbi:MAG TPA: hypothetical protein VKI41_00905 [Vicinamibacteria bacterium]|nr:hypothetical protein [Vicinamibacteria bacterium]
MLTLVLLFAAINQSTPVESFDGSNGDAVDTVYSANPDHPWNRLHRDLVMRHDREARRHVGAVGDPLLWQASTYLLDVPSHAAAIGRLDEFLRSDAASLIREPLPRAILQQDLWALFDWVSTQEQRSGEKARDLLRRLVAVLRQLALTPAEIRALPDNYRQAVAAGRYPGQAGPLKEGRPFLPADLFAPDGSWVSLSALREEEPLARFHVGEASGRAVFHVLIRLPGGRAATLHYLERLRSFPLPGPLEPDGRADSLPSTDVPQFPPGTQLALVRRGMVIDTKGMPSPVPIVTQLQLRVHRGIPAAIPEGGGIRSSKEIGQQVFEFRVGRAQLLAGDSGGLVAVGESARAWPTFLTHGLDEFDSRDAAPQGPPVVLQQCVVCHSRPGIHSVNSFAPLFGPRGPMAPGTLNEEAERTVAWKRRQADWGLLQRLWW